MSILDFCSVLATGSGLMLVYPVYVEYKLDERRIRTNKFIKQVKAFLDENGV